MSQPIWQRLMIVITLDQKSRAIHQDIDDCKKQINIKNHHKTILAQTIQEHEHEINLLKKDVKNFEKEMSEISSQANDKRKILDNIKNPKELRSFEKELKNLESIHENAEEKLLSAWHKLENSEKKLIQEKEVYKDNLQLIENEIKDINDKIQSLLLKLEEYKKEHDQALKDIPAEWKGRYQHMKGKVPDPIVPMINDSCSACFYFILPSDCARIKKGAVLPCHNCYRLIYYSKDEEKKEEIPAY